MVSHGAYLVTYRTCTSGRVIVDISRVVGGLGITSNPWIVRSLLADDRYPVAAIDIAPESYKTNLSLEDVEVLYKSITGIDPDYLLIIDDEGIMGSGGLGGLF